MKNMKRICAVLLVVLQLFLLCGCSALEEMRDNQAFYDAGKIVRNGVTYQLLPSCEDLSPTVDYTRLIYVTAPDVPVLLSTIYANEVLRVSEDGDFLVNISDDSIYCRQDLHQQLSQRIRDGFTPAVFCYSYEVYEEDTWDYTEERYTLTDEQVDVLELITSTVEPQTMGDGWSLDYDWSVTLEGCSEDMLFRRSEMDIAYTGRSYYLVLYTDTETLAFAVPDGCNDQLDKITEAHRTAWESFWEDEEDFI